MVKITKTIWQHFLQILGSSQARPAGSPANQRTGVYIQNVFRQAGLNVEAQNYSIPVWESTTTRLTIGQRTYSVAGNAFSPSCTVKAATRVLSTRAELAAADLRGKIAVLCGELTNGPIAPKAWFLKTPKDEEIIRQLEIKKPLAVLCIQPQFYDLIRIFEDSDFHIPSATVPIATGLKLVKTSPVVSLEIKARRGIGQAANWVAETPGKAKRKIVVCAHYDTKIDTPGALDNAAGVAVMLTLAQQVRLSETTLEWVAFNNEEYLPIGDDEYIRRRGKELGSIVAAINLDGIGQWLGPNSITSIAGSMQFHKLVSTCRCAYPGLVQVEPWPQSNHSTFSFRGVPSIAMTSHGGAVLHHTRKDSAQWVSPARLFEAFKVVKDLLEHLGEKDPVWTRKPKGRG